MQPIADADVLDPFSLHRTDGLSMFTVLNMLDYFWTSPLKKHDAHNLGLQAGEELEHLLPIGPTGRVCNQMRALSSMAGCAAPNVIVNAEP